LSYKINFVIPLLMEYGPKVYTILEFSSKKNLCSLQHLRVWPTTIFRWCKITILSVKNLSIALPTECIRLNTVRWWFHVWLLLLMVKKKTRWFYKQKMHVKKLSIYWRNYSICIANGKSLMAWAISDCGIVSEYFITLCEISTDGFHL